MTGNVIIGFEVNKKEFSCVEICKSHFFGAYECSFHKRAVFVYKSSKEPVTGFFVRKQKWAALHHEYPDFMV